jgi:2'-5' RNA ligase
LKTSRLFFALWPDADMRRRIHKACKPAVDRCGGRPVPPRNYHLTLAFLGSVADELIPQIRAAAAPIPAPTLELVLDRYGRFPGPRVAWVGPAQSPPELANLAGALSAAVETLGLEADRRPFRPHLTVARKIVRDPPAAPDRPVVWTVQSYALIRSVTAPEGARYLVDQAFPEGSSTEP